jgi:hypothetical protein
MSRSTSDVVVFRVIGELRGDPSHLLLASPDGSCYDYDIARGTVTPVSPTDAWWIDLPNGAEVRMWAPSPRVVA